MPDHKDSKTTRHIACNDIVPGCGFTATGDTDEELISKDATSIDLPCRSAGVIDRGATCAAPRPRQSQRHMTPADARANVLQAKGFKLTGPSPQPSPRTRGEGARRGGLQTYRHDPSHRARGQGARSEGANAFVRNSLSPLAGRGLG
jgi:hypothetical protein